MLSSIRPTSKLSGWQRARITQSARPRVAIVRAESEKDEEEKMVLGAVISALMEQHVDRDPVPSRVVNRRTRQKKSATDDIREIEDKVLFAWNGDSFYQGAIVTLVAFFLVLVAFIGPPPPL